MKYSKTQLRKMVKIRSMTLKVVIFLAHSLLKTLRYDVRGPAVACEFVMAVKFG